MERVIFLTRIKQFLNIKKIFSRVYFGEEFCRQRIPKIFEFKKAQDIAKKSGLDFTCVLPYFTENSINTLPEILNQLSACEVVVNDYGSLYYINKFFPNFTLVLGRLLTKQRRGNTILSFEKLSSQEKKYLSISCVNIPVWEKILKQFNVNRVEIDILPKALPINTAKFPLNWSIYYPYGYLTTTRWCLYNYKETTGRTKTGEKNCAQQCIDKKAKLCYPSSSDSKIYLRGNTQLFKNEKYPSDLILSEIGINRIIMNEKIFD